MADFYRGFHFVGWLLLIVCSWAVDTPTPTSPQTVEVDLIFPRNETYAPISLMPMVFAIQNFRVAKSLLLKFDYTLEQVPYIKTKPLYGISDLKYTNYSGSRNHFQYAWTTKLNNTEGTWLFTWTLRALNCSQPTEADPEDPGPQKPLHLETVIMSNSVYFTTTHGAKQPDLVAATQDGACAESQADTMNITGILDVPWSDSYWGSQSACPLLSTVTPTANPCGVKIDSSAASSISYVIQSSACLSAVTPTVACPPGVETANSAHHAEQFLVSVAGLFAATLGWLIFLA